MEQGSAPVGWTEEDWEQARQAWRDWRDVITRHYDRSVNRRLEQAWAAGLLDSEESYAIDVDTPPETPRALKLQIVQPFGAQGHINLVRFQSAVEGAGTISGPQEIGGHTCYLWQATTKADVEKVWAALGPFLGPVRFSAFRHALVTPGLRNLQAERTRRKGPSKIRQAGGKKAKGRKATRQSTRKAARSKG